VGLAQAVLALPEVAVAPALLSQPPVLALAAVLVPLEVAVAPALLAQRAVPELPEVVVALAAEEEPEALVELLSSQSFSAAMARTTP
jgi:hypothetical protein